MWHSEAMLQIDIFEREAISQRGKRLAASYSGRKRSKKAGNQT
jgi:hypothetical protein